MALLFQLVCVRTVAHLLVVVAVLPRDILGMGERDIMETTRNMLIAEYDIRSCSIPYLECLPPATFK